MASRMLGSQAITPTYRGLHIKGGHAHTQAGGQYPTQALPSLLLSKLASPLLCRCWWAGRCCSPVNAAMHTWLSRTAPLTCAAESQRAASVPGCWSLLWLLEASGLGSMPASVLPGCRAKGPWPRVLPGRWKEWLGAWLASWANKSNSSSASMLAGSVLQGVEQPVTLASPGMWACGHVANQALPQCSLCT